jgi:hypothetical protein
MKRAWGLAVLAAGLVFAVERGAAADEKKEGPVVEIDGLKAAVPGDWKEEKPKNLLRWKTFKLPKAKDDKADAELALFQDLGGTPEENVKRWKAKFKPPEDKTIDDVSKVSKFKIGSKEATYFEVYGTYIDKPFPMATKFELRPDYRMIAIQYDGDAHTYHMLLIGPAATIEAHKKEFDGWLKALKK